MISHPHKFIFVHIPRTGGTSLSETLAGFGIQKQGKANFDSIYFKHATAKDLKRMLGDEFDTFFRFSVVRNPWDWVVSNYYFNGGLHRPFVANSPVPHAGKQPPWVGAMGFHRWVEWWLTVLKPTQMQMIADDDGHLLVNEVLRFEALELDQARLGDMLGLALPVLPTLKQSHRPQSYRDVYDSRTAELVAHHFSAEIAAFGYSF